MKDQESEREKRKLKKKKDRTFLPEKQNKCKMKQDKSAFVFNSNNFLPLLGRLLTTIPIEVHGGQTKDQTQQTQKGITPSQAQFTVHRRSGQGNDTTSDTADDVVGCECTSRVGSEGIDEVGLDTCHGAGKADTDEEGSDDGDDPMDAEFCCPAVDDEAEW